jgi:hypothetical protein
MANRLGLPPDEVAYGRWQHSLDRVLVDGDGCAFAARTYSSTALEKCDMAFCS